VRLLLDTHVLIWWLEDSERLTPVARRGIEDPAAAVVVSAAGIWEIEIKRTLGKLDVPDDVLEQAEVNGFDLLPVTGQHAVMAGRLPRHHDDPFDRMLVAQAISEGLTLVTADRRLAAYDVGVLPV
jgi:PIN domain nuclease of toxin-antitoxin system